MVWVSVVWPRVSGSVDAIAMPAAKTAVAPTMATPKGRRKL